MYVQLQNLFEQDNRNNTHIPFCPSFNRLILIPLDYTDKCIDALGPFTSSLAIFCRSKVPRSLSCYSCSRVLAPPAPSSCTATVSRPASPSLPTCTVQYSTVQYITVQYSTVQPAPASPPVPLSRCLTPWNMKGNTQAWPAAGPP